VWNVPVSPVIPWVMTLVFGRRGCSCEAPSICLQATSSSFTASTLTWKFSLRLVVELDLDDPLDAAGADHDGHADIEVVDAVLAGEVRGAGQHALLVLEEALGHRDRAGRRGVKAEPVFSRLTISPPPPRVRLTISSIRSCVDQPILTRSGIGMPATVEYSTIGTIVSPWPPSTKAVTSSTDLELLGEEMAEARAVEHAGHADDLVVRQAGEFAQRPDHRVERVGDADDEGVGACFLMPSPTAFITFRLMPSRSSRLMPGLRGTPAVTMQTSAPAMSA
jgi:hypothetical protein